MCEAEITTRLTHSAPRNGQLGSFIYLYISPVASARVPGSLGPKHFARYSNLIDLFDVSYEVSDERYVEELRIVWDTVMVA